jgi:ADP-ribosyl-[dinitrogen reductase] hydrolase
VATVAGGLAGAVFGIVGIPMRWTSAVHGRVPGAADRVVWLAELHHLAAALDGSTAPPYEPPETRRLVPREVADGVWAADLDGARSSSPEFAVVSLCRTGSRFPHDVQRFAYLTDDDANTELDAVLADVLDDIAALRADGVPVLVHCFAGQSRTGLVLRAWLRRTRGMSAAEATAFVRQRWPYLSEWNADFTAALERVR